MPQNVHTIKVATANDARHALNFRAMVDYISDYFGRNPLYDPEGQPILVPEWSFPGRNRVQGQRTRAKTILDRILQKTPVPR